MLTLAGGRSGRVSGVNQRASRISVGSTWMSPASHSAVKAIISEWGKGQLWLPK